ncbi:MAG: universal stress protein [Ignavibacteria bacterium CG_4_8_14_3_um_filter_37_9]|nr:universal stress protein [Ignavibacteria bacterium]OIO23104.1 MAG: stress protein UspA [Ignavibacteria bacterium CG1_02_37_35]PIP79609.1 MAG: stress protein UspA [Ignavibacteria bacterium CG22_combo_CG10-13_8_21_14_all_37_15]PIS45930.1 MAG: universal stress protein [Ignavibacteria bacterium CG08_land_8_20_14_0_20_37_9]PIW98620.1 MAG: universal stress protein [Ignavibacteria bacterium CG_4_8_14_3_um_filter_37_9]PIX93757.1 MAG: universal stress protein [Ignavibacteria bacterium CG_4_10_14_3_u
MELQFSKILVPIDFSDFSKSALKYAVIFAKQYHAQLILVYVLEPVIYPPDFSMGQITLPTVNFEMDKRAKEELDKLAETEIGSLVEVRTVLKTGKPFVEIIETAKEEDADLIIISTHGHSGVEHILFGSTADKVVRKAPCPVLTLREPIKGFDYKNMIKK